MMNRTIPAFITATLAAGSESSPFYYDVNITQRLCKSVCCDDTPVFTPSFSVVSVANVGNNQYIVTMHVEGAVHYVPCHCGSCATKAQIISQDFAIPVYSTVAVTDVTVAAGTSINAMVKHSCCECSDTFASDTPLYVAVLTA